jgi:hypothetical protein
MDPAAAGITQIRSFTIYRDKVTGIQRVFAGTNPWEFSAACTTLSHPAKSDGILRRKVGKQPRRAVRHQTAGTV